MVARLSSQISIVYNATALKRTSVHCLAELEQYYFSLSASPANLEQQRHLVTQLALAPDNHKNIYLVSLNYYGIDSHISRGGIGFSRCLIFGEWSCD